MSEITKELRIKLDVDNTDATRASRIATEELKRIEVAADKVAKAQKQGAEEGTAAHKRAAREAADAHVEGFGRMGQAGDKFAGVLGNMAVQMFGIGKLEQIVVGIGSAFEKARTHAREVADEILRTRDAIRELEGITKKPADLATTREMYKFGAETGMTPDQATAYQSTLYGSGEQYISKLGKGEAGRREMADLALATARIAVAKKIDPRAMGELAGTIVGTSDWSRFGDQAGENAAAMASSAINILNEGSGDPTKLALQLKEVGAALVNEDPNKGIFRDFNEAAIAVSAAAEKNPEEAATSVRSTATALRKFESPVIQAANITPKDTYFSGVAKMKAFFDKKIAEGVNPVDVLNAPGSLLSIQEVSGLQVAVNKGEEEGIFKSRRDSITGVDALEADWRKAMTSPDHAVPLLISKAKEKLGEFDAGLPAAKLEGLRADARTAMRADKTLDTPAYNALESALDLNPIVAAGFLRPTRETRVDERLYQMLHMRGEAAGYDTGPFPYGSQQQVEAGLVEDLRAVEAAEAQLRVLEEIRDQGRGDRAADFKRRVPPTARNTADTSRQAVLPGD